ncbi:hypothetical protein [Desertivirga arenae]|uniref:hypothetical protein n=1 Tax=Desertivirga arenae TaxID=2810309 RepID=UPI001A96F5CE|nr:hypothetical protein [Pedobacter sp. SYSU D00823]
MVKYLKITLLYSIVIFVLITLSTIVELSVECQRCNYDSETQYGYPLTFLRHVHLKDLRIGEQYIFSAVNILIDFVVALVIGGGIVAIHKLIGKPVSEPKHPCRKPDMRFQIEEMILEVDFDATAKYYAEQPQIKENCSCGDCKYFQDELIRQPIKLFELLKQMGVDLSRQPDINPDGIFCINDDITFRKKYVCYYLVVGQIVEFKEKSYTDNESNSLTTWEVKQQDEFLKFDFFIQYDRI